MIPDYKSMTEAEAVAYCYRHEDQYLKDMGKGGQRQFDCLIELLESGTSPATLPEYGMDYEDVDVPKTGSQLTAEMFEIIMGDPADLEINQPGGYYGKGDIRSYPHKWPQLLFDELKSRACFVDTTVAKNITDDITSLMERAGIEPFTQEMQQLIYALQVAFTNNHN